MKANILLGLTIVTGLSIIIMVLITNCTPRATAVADTPLYGRTLATALEPEAVSQDDVFTPTTKPICQRFVTRFPRRQTQCIVARTQCTAIITECPVGRQCREIPTVYPVIRTECPKLDTLCQCN